MPKGPSAVFHIGRPDTEEPHRSLQNLKKFHTDFPETDVIFILWNQEDADKLGEFLEGPHESTYHWKDDPHLMSFLLDRLPSLVGAEIVSPLWYKCPSGHLTARNAARLLIEKCGTCGEAVVPQQLYEDEKKKFCEVFLKAIRLANFDTRSGEWLNDQVSPMRNLLLNMRYAFTDIQARDVREDRRENKEKIKPVVICGAGPSLEDALPYLKRLQGSHEIICVGRSFSLLRTNDIKVDYVVSVEMFDWDSAIFEGLTKENVGDAVMCYASVGAAKTTEKWPGKRLCLWDCHTAELLGRDDWILGGNSVSHFMLNFAAQTLLAEEIIMVGIDLAYTKPKTHADGTIPATWPESIKAQDAGYHNEEKWVPCTGKGNDFNPECHRTPVFLGMGGFAPSRIVEVRSSQPYADFCTLFEILIAKHGVKVYNACPNGQKIDGTEYLDLAERARMQPRVLFMEYP